MKLLFIGGTGNISTDCAALLHAQDHEVAVLSRGRAKAPQEYRTFVADRKNPQSMRAALGDYRPDVVLNFIGYELQDVQADVELFDRRLAQYIFISSATVYAKPPAVLPITEDAPLGNRFWDYAAKKLECERWLLQQWHTTKFPVTIVRPSHTYSKLWIPNAVSSSSYTFAARLEQGRPVYVHDDGQTPWTLTATSDFAVGLAGLVGNQRALGEAFHITSDEVLSWNEIYREIANALGVPLREVEKIPTDFICSVAPRFTGTLKGDKAHPGVFDNSKIKRFVPGFQCKKTFAKGVSESVAWLRAHPASKNLEPDLDALITAVIQAWRSRAP